MSTIGKQYRRARFAWLCVALAVAPTVARAQVNGPHIILFPYAGYANFAKNVNIDDDPIFGGALGINFHRYVGIEGRLGISTTNTINGFTPYAVPVVAPAVGVPHDLDVWHYGADLVVSMRPSAFFDPYVLAGWQEGRLKFPDDEVGAPNPVYQNGWELGGGVKIRLNSRISARAEFRDALWKFPAGTPPPAGEDATDNQFYTAGVEFAIGGKTGIQDADQDGIPDKKDKCPDTPLSAHVDANGCPIDADQDGIADGIDQCPNTPTGATVDARGCPNDADADGVPDGIDQCADSPHGASVDTRGCPKDSDADGVPDGIDQCADTPTGTKVDERGCAIVTDTDGDGVPDDKDLCPHTMANAKVDKDGCPIELTEREVELLDKGVITERNIHFATAKWEILPESRPVLDDIGAILIQWPRLRIEIGGHCDARGSDAYNLDLSDKRANSVREYLSGKYPQLTAESLTSKGYGERVPVATNKTVEGMAQNRRVEFKVLNQEELKKERARRKTVQQGE
jgi:outer membrane protein OmpA-like peptidoglycan-associated protein/opacity protein-like surface antigen